MPRDALRQAADRIRHVAAAEALTYLPKPERFRVRATAPLELEGLETDTLLDERDDDVEVFTHVRDATLEAGDILWVHPEAGPEGEISRWNIVSVIDAAAHGGSASVVDASATVKGITKLSVPPTSPTNPVAVGDNDPRLGDPRPPSGAAGGDLTGSYPNPSLAAGVVTNAHVSAVAGIARSKLNFGAGLTNADLAAGASIARSKLDFGFGLTNGDIAAAAGITYSKLNLAGSIVHGDVAAANKDGAAGVPSLRTLGTGALQAAAGNDARFGPVVWVDDYPRLTGETDDTLRMNRASADAAAQGRPIGWRTSLMVDGWNIPSNTLAVGPGKLTVVGTQPFPLYMAPGVHDVTLRGFEIDGNKAAISGDPDVIGNPGALVMADGTIANPCRRIYIEDLHGHDSKRLGIMYCNVQDGRIRARVHDNERDGVTLYYNCRHVYLDLDVWNNGDDHCGINSGEDVTVGLCEHITGYVRAYGPSPRSKGRAVTVRGGKDIRLDVNAQNMSQSAVVLQTWTNVDLTNVYVNAQIDGVVTGGTGDKDGVQIIALGTAKVRGVHLTGSINGATDNGVRLRNMKTSPADGDMQDIFFNDMDISNCGAAGVGFHGSAGVGITDVWFTDVVARFNGGNGFDVDAGSGPKRIRFSGGGAYGNGGWGARVRLVEGGAIRGMRITGNGNGLDYYGLSGTFDISANAVWGNTGVQTQDDGGHTATFVSLDTRGGINATGRVNAGEVFSQPGAANQIALASDGNLYFSSAGGRPWIGGAPMASTHLSDSAALARLASPTFTGTVTIPTLAATTLSGNPTLSGAPSVTGLLTANGGLLLPANTRFGVAGGVAVESSLPATGLVFFNRLLAADGNAAYSMFGDGTMKWGAGGASAVDMSLDRPGAQALRVSASGTPGTNERLRLGVTGVGFFGHAEQARPAAYTLNSSTTSRNLPASGTATAAQVADVLRQLVTDLQGYGLLA